MKDEDSFVICDAKTKGFPIQYVSRGFQDLFGYDASECVGALGKEVFGSVPLITDKLSRAALNKVAAELGLSDEQATAGIKRMAEAAEEAAQAASAGATSQTVLLINSRKNGDLFACEMSLCLQRHPTTGWEYHAGVSRDVSDLVSVSQLLQAASAESSSCFDKLCQDFRRLASRGGAEPLQKKLGDASPELHEIAEKMWKERLTKVFNPEDAAKAAPDADRRSIWSRSTASSLHSRAKRSRIEVEADGSVDKEPVAAQIPHLGAFFGQCPVEPAEVSNVPAEVSGQENDRFLDLLEGPDSDDEDSDGDEKMAFAARPQEPLLLPRASPTSPADLESRNGSKSSKPASDFSMEEETSSDSTEGRSPISDASILGDDTVDPVQLVGRDVLLGLALPLVMAAPTAPGFPVVLRSKGFEALAEPSAAIGLGSSARETLRPVSMDLQQTWSDFCDAIAEDRFHVDPATGSGVMALEGVDDVALPAGELVFVRPFHCRSGKLVDYLVYIKQVELDNCPFLLAVHTPLPVAEAVPHKERSQLLQKEFEKASTRLDDAISELASEFFYYAPMRRQRMRPNLPQTAQDGTLKAASA